MTSFTDSSFDDDFKPRQPVNVREIIHKYMYHWPVFVAGLLLAYTVAFLYLRYTPPVYNVKTTLLIKDTKNDNANLLKELNMFSDSRVVDNEMQILKSKSLMLEVVKRLHLGISYQTKGRALMTTDIYYSRPFNVVYAGDEGGNGATGGLYTIHIINSNDYEAEDKNTGQKWTGKFNLLQKTPIGICRLEKTARFSSYTGQVVYLSFKGTEATANDILKNLVLSQVNRQTSVIELSLNEGVPERGEDILNTLVEVYSQAAIDDKNQSVKNSIRFIKERLAYITGELNEVEKVAEQFKANHGFIDLSRQAESFLEEVKNNDSKLNEINLQLKVVEVVGNYINTTAGKGELPSMVGITEPVLVSQVGQLNTLELQRERLAETTTDDNPLMVSLDKQVRNARTMVKNTLKNLQNSLVRTKEQLQATNSRYEATIRTFPSEEREFVNINRQQHIKETLYLLLLQKMEEAGLSSAVTLADSRTLEKAYGPKTPVSPQQTSVYLFALLAGFVLPLLYVFSKDSFNFRVISNNDITDRTAVPISGDVMFEEDAPAIVLTNNSRSLIAEQFRTLRTNLQYVYGSDPGSRVTLVTSSMTAEGKSFISANLAAALAMAGRKTMLLELDMRNPKISKRLSIKNKTGLSNYLIGKASLEEIVQASGVYPNLYVISSGPIPPNPAELLEQNGIKDLIQKLRTEFQEILIDTPPIGLVTDAMILGPLADATIYVVRHAFTFKSQVLAIEQLRREQKFPKLNIVHNGVQASGRFGYGYESPYGYGYGYEAYYGEGSKKPKRRSLLSFILNFFKRF